MNQRGDGAVQNCITKTQQRIDFIQRRAATSGAKAEAAGGQEEAEDRVLKFD